MFDFLDKIYYLMSDMIKPDCPILVPKTEPPMAANFWCFLAKESEAFGIVRAEDNAPVFTSENGKTVFLKKTNMTLDEAKELFYLLRITWHRNQDPFGQKQWRLNPRTSIIRLKEKGEKVLKILREEKGKQLQFNLRRLKCS